MVSDNSKLLYEEGPIEDSVLIDKFEVEINNSN